MKRVLIILTAAVLALALPSVAKELKVGYVDSDRLLEQNDDFKEARDQLQKEEREYASQAQTLEKIVEDMFSDLKSQSLMLSDEARQDREQKLRDKQQELDTFRQDIWGPTGRLFARNEELMKPIHDKILAAIEKVSQEDAYDFVFDAVTGNLVYALPEHDITDRVLDVLKKE